MHLKLLATIAGLVFSGTSLFAEQFVQVELGPLNHTEATLTV